MPRPLVSIIVVNWNTRKLLKNCLSSVIAGTKIPMEAIVVDNGSTDDSVRMIKNSYRRKARLVETGKNLGMGAGNNRGLEKAKGKYLLILNSDTVVPRGAIEKLVVWMDKHPAVGVVGPRLRYPDGRLQTSGGSFPSLLKTVVLFLGVDDVPFLSRFLPLYQRGGMYLSGKQTGMFNREHKIDWLMGACLLMRRKIYEEVGGFDEKIFMYGEEVEWAYRVFRAGFSIWYTPSVWITHIKGASSTSGLRGPILGEMRGLLYFFSKHKPAWEVPVLRVVLKVGSLGRIFLFSLLKRPELAGIYMEALRI